MTWFSRGFVWILPRCIFPCHGIKKDGIHDAWYSLSDPTPSMRKVAYNYHRVIGICFSRSVDKWATALQISERDNVKDLKTDYGHFYWPINLSTDRGAKELEWWKNNVHTRPQSVLYTQYWILIGTEGWGHQFYLSQGMILLYTAIDSGITCLETFAAELTL